VRDWATTRHGIALVVAAALHAILLFWVSIADVEQTPRTRDAVALKIVDILPPQKRHVEMEPEPEAARPDPAPEPPRPLPRETPIAEVVPPKGPDIETAPPSVDVALESGGPRLAPGPADSKMSAVVGIGPRALTPNLGQLEGALDDQAVGPRSDGERTAAVAREFIEEELSRDAISLGLVDDYLRVLKDTITTAWRPARAQLNDGGKKVGRVGFMQNAYSPNPAWGELWQTYFDLAGQYARTGTKPRITKKKLERLRELMRSRQRPFRFSTISEIEIAQDAQGKLLHVDIALGSGHPLIDVGIKEAVARALRVMPNAPPLLMTHGKSTKSRWRFRATWTMIPPTAWLQGAGWDIGPKGLEFDVPFQIKLKTVVALVDLDAKKRGGAVQGTTP
jgi:hypothetical protein